MAAFNGWLTANALVWCRVWRSLALLVDRKRSLQRLVHRRLAAGWLTGNNWLAANGWLTANPPTAGLVE